MSQPPEFGPNSEAVRAHLNILQDVIRRLAGNSASCKNWCVVLVAAMLVLVARTDTLAYALLALMPTLLLGALDAYYLALEQAFRRSYDDFVCKLHRGEVVLTDLYKVHPGLPVGRQLWVSTRSASVLPFYGALLITIVLVWKFDCVGVLLGW